MKLHPLNRNQINANEFLNRRIDCFFQYIRSFRSYVDAISENKEHDRKHRKLDHLIDLAGDGSGVAGDDEEIVIVRYITSNVLEAYSLGYCLGSANWMIDCGGEKISIVSSSSTVQNIHPLPFDKTVLNNADVIILSDLRDKDGARFETIFIEIGNCVGFLSQHIRAVGLRGIPFYAVSPIAEESLIYVGNGTICTERQQKMYLPDNLMHYQDMIEQSLLYYASRTDSSLQENIKNHALSSLDICHYVVVQPLISLESGEIIQTIQ
ncbi:hypothetical protein RhiirA4_547927 [Rhizophagus irregularis]|uniref:Uncharacterized protein n=1 Tax=Rhizophagus irregularis TaxID=588596 RepID=A0A2I1H4Y3_9GLOM|nr:hypothetical protein RhiirA4_547927 [Rhizophagus irregularis]